MMASTLLKARMHIESYLTYDTQVTDPGSEEAQSLLWSSSDLTTQAFRKPCGLAGGLLLGHEDAGRVASLGQPTCPV